MSTGPHIVVTRTSNKMEVAPQMTGDKVTQWDIVQPLSSSSLSAPMGGGASTADSAGGAPVGEPMPAAPVVGLRLTKNEETEVQDSGNGIGGYSQATIKIPREVIVDGSNPEVLIVWTPDINSASHTSKVNVTARVTAHALPAHGSTGHSPASSEIKIGMQRNQDETEAAAAERGELRGIIERLVHMAVEEQSAELKGHMERRTEENVGWGIVDSPAPIIETAMWQSVYNMMEHHSVGIKIHEGATAGAATQKLMRKELYVDTENGISEHFQIVAHPFGGTEVRSDYGKATASLLVHKTTTNNNFVANTVLSPGLKESLLQEVSGADVVEVKLHHNCMLWALQRMEDIFQIYVTLVKAGGVDGITPTRTEVDLAKSSRVNTTLAEFAALAKDAEADVAGVLISRTLAILAKYPHVQHHNLMWKIVSHEYGFRYNVPRLFYYVIVDEFVKQLKKHQALNSGTALHLTAYALPAFNTKLHERKLSDEQNTTVAITACIVARYPTQAYCYVPYSNTAF